MAAISGAASAASAAPITKSESAAPITKSESADNALEFLQTDKIGRLGGLPTDLIRKIVYYAPGSVTVSSCFFRGLFLDDNPKAYHKLIQIADLPWIKALQMKLPDIKSPPPQDKENFFGKYLSIKLAKAFKRSIADGVEYFNGLPEDHKGLISTFRIHESKSNVGDISQLKAILARCSGLKELILETNSNQSLLEVVPTSVYANLRRVVVRDLFSRVCTEDNLRDLLENGHQLENLELINLNITMKFLDYIFEKMPLLRLSLISCVEDGINLGDLLVKFPQLEYLRVFFLSGSLTGEKQSLATIPEKTFLKEVYLSNSQHLTREELISLIRSCSDTLSHLNLNTLDKITGRDLRVLRECHKLEQLGLIKLPIEESESGFDVTSKSAPVSSINIQGNPGSNGARAEASIKNLLKKHTQLSSLFLKSLNLTGDCFRAISENSSLKEIVLSEISGLELANLTSLIENCPNLKKLFFFVEGINLTDEFFEALPFQTELTLRSYFPISDEQNEILKNREVKLTRNPF